MMHHNQLLKKSISFISKGKNIGKDTSINPSFFLTSWAENIGFLTLKAFVNEKIPFLKKFKIILKESIASETHRLQNNTKLLNRHYDSLVFTYFFPENIKKNGNYFDKYFSVETKNFKKVLWVLIPLNSSKKQVNSKSNIIILDRTVKREFSLYLKILIKSTVFFLLNIFASKEKFFFNEKINFSIDFVMIINRIIKFYNIKKVIYPYEGQPHQTYFNKKLKSLYPKIKIIGYMHTALPPLPLEYIKKNSEPDVLYVNGIAQKKILINHFNWSDKKILNIVSMRYKKSKKISMSKKIFLPYYIENQNIFYESFKKLIYSKPRTFFPKLQIQNHPSMKFSKTHLELIKNINIFLKKEKNYFKDTKTNKNTSIFFGSSAAVLEALERNTKVFHICSNVTFEKFDNFYWKDIKIININNNIFEYKLLKPGRLIKIGVNTRIFNKII